MVTSNIKLTNLKLSQVKSKFTKLVYNFIKNEVHCSIDNNYIINKAHTAKNYAYQKSLLRL